MPIITGFSPVVYEALKPFSFRVLRQATASVPIEVHSMKCSKCGFTVDHDPPIVQLATGIEDVEWTHEFSWELGARCGGQMSFATTPHLRS